MEQKTVNVIVVVLLWQLISVSLLLATWRGVESESESLIWRRLRLRAISVLLGHLCDFVVVFLTFVQLILQLKLCLCAPFIRRLLKASFQFVEVIFSPENCNEKENTLGKRTFRGTPFVFWSLIGYLLYSEVWPSGWPWHDHTVLGSVGSLLKLGLSQFFSILLSWAEPKLLKISGDTDAVSGARRIES